MIQNGGASEYQCRYRARCANPPAACLSAQEVFGLPDAGRGGSASIVASEWNIKATCDLGAGSVAARLATPLSNNTAY